VLGRILNVGLMLFALLYLLLTMGDILPLWCFINTLQLILHTPLFDTIMPGNVAFFFKQIIDITRFDFFPFTYWIRQAWGSEPDGPFSLIFEVQGYSHHHLIPLLGFLFVAGGLIFVVWLVAGLKDLCVRYVYRPNALVLLYKHERWVYNFGVRFAYEAFFEICLSSFINIQYLEWKSSHSEWWQSYLSVAFLVTAVTFVLFIEALFWRGAHVGRPKTTRRRRIFTWYERWVLWVNRERPVKPVSEPEPIPEPVRQLTPVKEEKPFELQPIRHTIVQEDLVPDAPRLASNLKYSRSQNAFD